MPGSPDPPPREPVLRRAGRSFGRFWWDFLIGDTPELFVATVVTLVVVLVLARLVSSTIAWVVLPVLVIAALTGSVLRGRRS